MRRITIMSLLVSILCASAWCGDDAKSESFLKLKLADAPKEIQELAAAIKDKPRNEVETIIAKQFGKAQRDVGSGRHLYQWDVGDGVLHFAMPGSEAPSFSRKGFMSLYLKETANPVLENLLGSYEITTLPEPKHHNTFWIGNFKIDADQTYHYTDGSKSAPADLYLKKYPTGKVAIAYADKITAETLLESLPYDTLVAELTFSAGDTKEQLVMKIKTNGRLLHITSGETPLAFTGYAGWKNW